jgi:hypothetical protein
MLLLRHNDKTMSKAKKFSGQPILSQIFKCIPKELIAEVGARHNADYYYKRIPLRTHLTCLLYGVFSYCNGLREICEGMLACEGKLTHLGLSRAPARSTLSDANRDRTYLIFEQLYFSLVRKYHSFISDSRLKGLSIRNLRIIDSSTVRLFTEILRGVGRNPLDGAKKKGGFKVHALMDAFSGIAEFVRITAAREADRNFLYHLKLAAKSWIVFDKGYNVYSQFAKWTVQQVWFVTRMRENAVFHVCKVLQDNTKKAKAKGVLKEQYISVEYNDAQQEKKRVQFRRIVFKADDGKVYVFMTNNFIVSAEEIARIYKSRWMIEILFKQIKQNFPLKYFWGANENAIRTQVYSVLIAQLLMVVIRKKSKTKKSFSNMITVIRLHLMSYIALFDFIKDTYKAWRKENDLLLFTG